MIHSSSRMKKIWFIFAWTILSSGLLMANAVAAAYFIQKSHEPVALIGSRTSVIASSVQGLPQPFGEVKGVSTVIDSADARVQIVTNFLRRHESPLDADVYGKKLVTIADKYTLDFRLLPAISMQESNLCKVIP